MSFWDTFSIDADEGPKYLSICDALARAIADGRLAPGRRLPSHRMLARKLGVAVGTVTRAYEEALHRGLISGEVGRGSFVSHHPPELLRVVAYARADRATHDLYQNFPPPVADAEDRAWSDALAELAQENRLGGRLGARSWSEVTAADQRVGRRFMARLGFAADEAHILDCPGMPAALTAILAATTRTGDRILAPELSHRLIDALANRFGLRLRGFPVSPYGLDLDALDRICREETPKLLYISPTHHSPTTLTLGKGDRMRLAEIARAHDLIVVEDEAAAFLLEEPTAPVASYAPERTILIADVWMSLSMGLRTCYLRAPAPIFPLLSQQLATVTGTTAPLMAEIAARWIESGVADRLIDARRQELAARNRILDACLGSRRIHRHEHGLHAWLELDPPWRGDRFVQLAAEAGVAVAGANWFFLGHGVPPAGARVCLGTAPTRKSLRTALEILDGILDAPPEG